MRNISFSFLKRILCLILFFALLISFVSCKEKKDALTLMEEFISQYSLSGVVYSPSFGEGEEGYVSDDFFITMYSESSESVSDFAVLLQGDLDSVGECGVFLCYSDYDAILVSSILHRRIDFLKSFSLAIDTSSLASAFVMRKGRVVVMCALSDNELAHSVWKRII